MQSAPFLLYDKPLPIFTVNCWKQFVAANEVRRYSISSNILFKAGFQVIFCVADWTQAECF